MHGERGLQIGNDCFPIEYDRSTAMIGAMRIHLAGASAAVLILLAGCGGSDEPSPQADDSATVEETTIEDDEGNADGLSPSEPVAAPGTKVVICEIQDGLPVAEVRVTNTTGQASAFSIEVQFLDGDSVLGTGLEFTKELQPGQNQTVRMGNMQGDAPAVDTCEVLEAAPMDE